MKAYCKSRSIAEKYGRTKDSVTGGLRYIFLLLTLSFLVAGNFFVDDAGNKVKENFKKIAGGMAPTFAYELTNMGHSLLSPSTPSDDTSYISMIGTMVQWMKLNPEIESIYTMRKLSDGRNVFILGPETDYNRNDSIDTEKEKRVPIGEVYEEDIPELEQAFQGLGRMQTEATKDDWGYSISAFVPIFDYAGRQESILGVDFNGSYWRQSVQAERLDAMVYLLVIFIILYVTYSTIFRYRIEDARMKHHEEELTLNHAALLIAKDETEKANRAKTEFISRISHDMRTPLNAITGFAELLENRLNNPVSAPLHKMVREIHSAGTYVADLLDEMLDLSKIESGTISLTIEDVHLFPVIRSCIELIEPIALERSVSVIQNLSGSENTIVKADPVRLREILLNLLSNAVKYNRESGSINVACQAADDRMMHISVADTGYGIHESEIPSIFEPFVRLHNGDASAEGTGIGLTIVKKLIQLMGGRIGVESRLDHGSCFWIELPVVRDAPPPSVTA